MSDTNGATKIGKMIRAGGPISVAVLALILAGWMKFDAGARPDSYTQSKANARAEVVDDRIGRLERLVEKHAAMDAHVGAGRMLAAIQADLAHIRTDLVRIEGKLEGR